MARSLCEYQEISMLFTHYLFEMDVQAFFKTLLSEKIGSKQIRLMSELIVNNGRKHHMCKPSNFGSRAECVIEICLAAIKVLLNVEGKSDKAMPLGKRQKFMQAIFEPWGVCILDGLDIFDNFSQNYVLMS